MHRALVLFICLGSSDFVSYVCSTTSSAIPDLLRVCYQNNTLTANKQQPFTIRSLIEIIRKVEVKSDNALNARLLATSMLHSVIFDGVRRSEYAGDESVLPFRATGEEFYKYRLIVDYLTSGESSLFPTETLTTPELCFLHAMISNTVDPRKRGDESVACSHQSNMPFEQQAMEESGEISSCPIKKGSLSTKWGSVSAGHIIAAVGSALQQSKVPFERIEVAINNATDENVTNPPILPNTNNVNNVWVSTIAGDLATVILKQATETFEIGTEGFWNDTLLPRIYYLKNIDWEMTESDILGGVDGLAIAHYLKGTDTTKIRLSQLLDMYYSERGIFSIDEYKVTNRSLAFSKLLTQVDLTQQVASATKLLQQIGTYDSTLHHTEIDRLSEIVANKFTMITGNITKMHDSTTDVIHSVRLKSVLEIVLILDDSFSPYAAQQIIHGLSEAVEVSQYGNKLGVINGQSGNWMANVTGDLFQLFTNLQQAQNDWPSTLSLGRSLESVIYYYQNRAAECLNGKPTGRSILILSNNGRLTDNDFQSSVRALTAIKKTNPDANFILITTSEGKKRFEGLTTHFWDNDKVLTPGGHVHSLVQDISLSLSTLPGNIVNFNCPTNQVRLQDYITPNIDTFYEIRKEYIEANRIIAKFSSNSSLNVCVFSENNNEKCKEITVNDEISFDSRELCESGCNLRFRISANSSGIVCTELSCRYPDQVKLNIIWERNSGYTPVRGNSVVGMMIVSLWSIFLVK